ELAARHQAMILGPVEGVPFQPMGAERWVNPNCRIVAATNADLEENVRLGRFREDLFYRLAAVHVVDGPPPREQPGDRPSLVEHFMQQQPTPKCVSDTAMELLASLPWRGNVRELRGAVQHLAAHVASETITGDDVCKLPAARAKPAGAVARASSHEILVRLE